MNRNYLRRELTLIGGLVLVVAVALGFGRFGLRAYTRDRQQAHLRSSLPKLREELCLQRQILVSAILAYKQALGTYPPDHVVQQKPMLVDAVTNQLLYELLGTVYSASGQSFAPHNFPAIRKSDLGTFFNVGNLKNSAETPALARPFLKVSDLNSTVPISERPHVVALMTFYPNWPGVDPELGQQISAGSWCYNSSAPVHNTGGYDLWIEVNTPLTNFVIGNW